MTFGARAQHGANWKDYEEDFEESDTIMDLLHFGNNKIGQPYDLDLQLSGIVEVLDLGGRHWATRAINVRGVHCTKHVRVYVSAQEGY